MLNLNTGCSQNPAWIPGKHLPEPHLLLSPLAQLLQHCPQQPSAGIALRSMAVDSSSSVRGCQKRWICFRRVSCGSEVMMSFPHHFRERRHKCVLDSEWLKGRRNQFLDWNPRAGYHVDCRKWWHCFSLLRKPPRYESFLN